MSEYPLGDQRNKRPTHEMGNGADVFVAEKSDGALIELLGGEYNNQVMLSSSQLGELKKFYGFDESENHPLIKSGDVRNLFRQVEIDGVRIMAFLAKHGLLEQGEDPVRSLAWAIDQELYRTTPDIWNEGEEDE